MLIYTVAGEAKRLRVTRISAGTETFEGCVSQGVRLKLLSILSYSIITLGMKFLVSTHIMEFLCLLVHEKRGAEVSFAERSPLFATKPPSRKRKSGSFEFIGFMGRGFGGWVAGGKIPSGLHAFLCVSRYIFCLFISPRKSYNIYGSILFLKINGICNRKNREGLYGYSREDYLF